MSTEPHKEGDRQFTSRLCTEGWQGEHLGPPCSARKGTGLLQGGYTDVLTGPQTLRAAIWTCISPSMKHVPPNFKVSGFSFFLLVVMIFIKVKHT